MSMAALRWCRGLRGITSTQKLVLFALADTANDYGEAWPSALLLAEECCLSERAVRVALDVLEQVGLITGHRAQGRASRWVLNLDQREPARCAEEPEQHAGTSAPRSALPADRDSLPDPGTTFRPTPEPRSDPPRNVVPPTPERGSDRTLKNPHTTPIQPSTRAKPPEGIDRFPEFWRLFPRRVGKGAAEAAWAKALRVDSATVILQSLAVQVDLEKFDLREGGRFCPHPATWLNQKRWLDGMDDAEDDEPPSEPPEPSLYTATAEDRRP